MRVFQFNESSLRYKSTKKNLVMKSGLIEQQIASQSNCLVIIKI
jgi:hypothetical protein